MRPPELRIARRALLAAGLAAPMAARAGLPEPTVERFALWPGAPPGGEGLSVRDEVVKRSPNGDEDDIAWPHVATPMLTVVPAAQPNGAAVLICPGGGYARVATGRRGSSIARMFAGRGITAFELLYRLPRDGWAAGPDTPLQPAKVLLEIPPHRGRTDRGQPRALGQQHLEYLPAARNQRGQGLRGRIGQRAFIPAGGFHHDHGGGCLL